MTSGLDLVSQLTPQNAGEPGVEPGLAKAPSTLTERFKTALNSAANAPDDYWNARNAQSDRFQKISDDYFALTNERLANPFDVSITREEMRKYPNMPIPYVLQKRLAEAREKTRVIRDQVGDRGGVDPDFLNVDRINVAIGNDGAAMRQANEALIGSGGGAGAFVGEMVGGMAAPHMVAAGLVPVSRLPMAFAEGIGRTFLGNVGREALLQAGVQAGAEVVGQAVGYGTREQFGTPPTAGEMAQHVLGAGVGGAIFGGGLRATHLALGRLIHGPQVEIRPGEYGPAIEVPQSVKDAAVVMQTGDLYGHMNKLGIPEPAHDRAYLSAVNSVAAGRAAPVDVLPSGIPGSIPDIPATARLSETPGLTAPAAAPAPSSTGLAEFGGTAKDITGQLYDGLFGALQKGETRFAGIEDPVLRAARADFDAGRIKSPEDLADFVNKRGAFAAEGAPPVPAAEARPRLVVAREMPDGTIRYGEPGQIHADLVTPAELEARPYFPPSEEAMGFAEPGGKFMSRAEAADFVRTNEPERLQRLHEESGLQAEQYQRPIPAETGPENQPVMQRLADEVRNPVIEEGRPDFASAAKPTPPEEVAPKTAAVQSAEDKAVIAEAQALIERPDREVPRELREALAKATDDEAEAAIAVACIAGGGAL